MRIPSCVSALALCSHNIWQTRPHPTSQEGRRRVWEERGLLAAYPPKHLCGTLGTYACWSVCLRVRWGVGWASLFYFLAHLCVCMAAHRCLFLSMCMLMHRCIRVCVSAGGSVHAYTSGCASVFCCICMGPCLCVHMVPLRRAFVFVCAHVCVFLCAFMPPFCRNARMYTQAHTSRCLALPPWDPACLISSLKGPLSPGET